MTIILLFGLFSCSDSNDYKVRFDNVDRLTTGDKVIIKGLEIGKVKDLIIDEEKKVLVTISVRRDTKLTKGSTFTIHSDFLGTRRIEIELSDSEELINSNEIQTGFIQTLDSADIKPLTVEQRDSLIKHDPVYRLADTVFQILRDSKEKGSTKIE
ncbi:MAG: MCE family protein [Cyclobacteriaceae bacterium]|nr:MCE family protein [Cyclobacteriaceae bacterium]